MVFLGDFIRVMRVCKMSIKLVSYMHFDFIVAVEIIVPSIYILNGTVSDVSIESLILKSSSSIYFLIAVALLALVLPVRLFIRSSTIFILCSFVLR